MIDAYAKLCRAHCITLSSAALIAVDVEGYTLRGRATRLFGTFAAFQAAVTARHPDIKPPNRPTARDGRLLDSWQEVVACDAMCIAFPNAQIDTHVLLEGTRRSCDFVVSGSCYVEVLRLGKAEMATARNADAQKYARQWSAKMALYREMGVTPIMIEPADIHDPKRLAKRMAEIAAQLAISMQPLPAPSGKIVRAKGYWNLSTLCAAVSEVADAAGRWPTYAELTEAGYGHAAILLRQPGMAARVACKIGHVLRNQKGVWSQQRVLTELTAWALKHGQYPTALSTRCGWPSLFGGSAAAALQRSLERAAIVGGAALRQGVAAPLRPADVTFSTSPRACCKHVRPAWLRSTGAEMNATSESRAMKEKGGGRDGCEARDCFPQKRGTGEGETSKRGNSRPVGRRIINPRLPVQ